VIALDGSVVALACVVGQLRLDPTCVLYLWRHTRVAGYPVNLAIVPKSCVTLCISTCVCETCLLLPGRRRGMPV
jgi:hypothetical protein